MAGAESRTRARGNDPGRLAAAVTIVALLWLATPFAAARTPAADEPTGGQPTPAAEAVIARAVEAAGGRTAFAMFHNRKVTATMEIPAMGIKAPMTIYMERPDKQVAEIASAELGQLTAGTDGETCWENSSVQGPRIKHGGERALALRESDFDGLADWQRWYAKAECAGADTAAGKTVWKLLMTPKEGEVETWYFDQESGLPVKQSLTMTSEMGSIPMEAYPSDYRKVDGVMLPYRTRQVMMGGMQTMVLVTESIVHDVEIPPGRFDLPPEIRALKDKAAALAAKDTSLAPADQPTPAAGATGAQDTSLAPSGRRAPVSRR